MDPLFSTALRSYHGKKYIINIYNTDINTVEAPNDFDVLDNIGIIKTHGKDDRALHDFIKTSTFTFSIVINNPTTKALVDDMKISHEGKYYVEVKSNNDWDFGHQRLFIGRCIQQDPKLADEEITTYTVQCIDGISLLKEKYYTFTTHFETGVPTWKGILVNLLKKIDTIEKFYADTDTILEFASNLTSDDSVTNPYLETELYIPFIFTKERGYYTCYDVLESILHMTQCRLYWENGRYNVKGIETKFDTHSVRYYKKNASTGFWLNNANTLTLSSATNNMMSAGGNFIYRPGKKAVELIPDLTKQKINSASAALWNNSSTPYQFVGSAYDDKKTMLQINLQTTYDGVNADVPTNVQYNAWLIKFKFTTGSTIQYAESGIYDFSQSQYDIILSSTEGSIKVFAGIGAAPYDFFYSFILPAFTDITNIECSVLWAGYYDENLQFVSGGGTFHPWQATGIFSIYPQTTIKELIFRGSNDTENFKYEKFPILWADNQADLDSRMKIGDNFSHGLFRFRSTDSFESLEYAWVRQYIRYNTDTVETYDGTQNYYDSDQKFIKLSDSIVYRSRNYIPTATEFNLGFDEVKCIMISKPDPYSEITIEIDIVEETNTSGFSQNINGNKPLLFKFYSVNGGEVTLPYNIPNATIASMEVSIRVVVNGIEFYLHPTADTTKRDAFRVDHATNKILFNTTVKGRVFVWVSNYFIKGTTS